MAIPHSRRRVFCTLFLVALLSICFNKILCSALDPVEQSDHKIVAQQSELTEVHIVTISGPRPAPRADRNALRRDQEKQKLLARLEQKRTHQDKNHPRTRLLAALHSFLHYERRSKADLQRWRDNYKNVPRHQIKILEKVVKYSNKLSKTEHLIHWNQKLCDSIAKHAMSFYGVGEHELNEYIRSIELQGQIAERVSVAQALKHYVRDWSGEGNHERKTFPCILATLKHYSKGISRADTEALTVLLPGAGLGRLGLEIDKLEGYEVTINEWSMYMNLAYRFVESLKAHEQYTLYPFVDSWSHHATTEDMHRGVVFPQESMQASSVIMVEGDFSSVFTSSEGQFDFVVTHFFIDTARNLMNYLETIHAVLKNGGFWINSGPLLYGTGPWVQLSLDEIISVTEEMGFDFMDLDASCGELTFPDQKVRWMPGIYGSNERALHMNGYRVQGWVARKR